MAFEHKHWSKIICTRFIGITLHFLPRLLSPGSGWRSRQKEVEQRTPEKHMGEGVRLGIPINFVFPTKMAVITSVTMIEDSPGLARQEHIVYYRYYRWVCNQRNRYEQAEP